VIAWTVAEAADTFAPMGARALKLVADARAGCARLCRKWGAIAVMAASDALRNSFSRLLKKSEKFVHAGMSARQCPATFA
jgi:hypothetical protein